MNTSAFDARHPGLAPAEAASEPATVRLAIRVGYDGTAYNGWALQPGLPTVQGVLEDALALLVRRRIRTVVAGRTDAGVHARNQIAHFDLTPAEVAGLARGADIEPGHALVRRLRGVLGRQDGAILVHDVWIAPTASTHDSPHSGAATPIGLPMGRHASTRSPAPSPCGTRPRSMSGS